MIVVSKTKNIEKKKLSKNAVKNNVAMKENSINQIDKNQSKLNPVPKKSSLSGLKIGSKQKNAMIKINAIK